MRHQGAPANIVRENLTSNRDLQIAVLQSLWVLATTPQPEIPDDEDQFPPAHEGLGADPTRPISEPADEGIPPPLNDDDDDDDDDDNLNPNDQLPNDSDQLSPVRDVLISPNDVPTT